MTNKCFVFCHGFGLDSSYWAYLRPYFVQEKTVYLDLGYFGQEQMTLFFDASLDYIGIGHSLGLMKLMSLNIPFKALIGLHGFLDFLGLNACLHRHRTLELAHLTRHVVRSPGVALSQFYQRAGLTFDGLVNGPINQKKLLDDLDSLLTSRAIPPSIPMLILGSSDDKIVPPALIEDNFSHHPQVRIEILNQAKHGLGYLKSEVVYQKIMRFIHDD